MRTIIALSALLPTSRPSRPLIRILVCLLITTAIYCCAFAVSTANAATYYVDDANGNDACNGDNTRPWKTIPYTWSAARDGNTIAEGDTIYFRNGSYGAFVEDTHNNPWYNYYFDRNNWITYKAAPGHTPNLDSITVCDSNKVTTPYTAGRSYLVFDGFTIPAGSVSIATTNYIQLLNCNISGPTFTIPGGYLDWYIQANHLQIQMLGANHITINNCNLQKDFRAIQTQGVTTENSDVVISNCNIAHLSGQGIMGYTDNLTIQDSSITDINEYRSDYPISGTVSGTFTVGETVVQAVSGAKGQIVSSVAGGSGNIDIYQTSSTFFDSTHTITGQSSGQTVTGITQVNPTHTNAIYIMGGNNITIQRNKLITDSMNLCFYVYNVGDGGANYYVANNLVVAPEPNTATNYAVYANSHIEGVSGMTYVNNTVIGAAGVEVRTLNNTSTEVTNFYNNIVSKLSLDKDTGGRTVKITNHGNNIFGNNPNGAGGPTYPFVVNGTEKINAPLTLGYFTNYTAGSNFANFGSNFTLVTGSPAIDFGNSTYAPATDILGNTRDSKPDAGCYEYINHPPVLGAIGDKTVDENSPLSFTVTATDADGNQITYSAQNLPAGATFVGQTFSWTPNYNQAGSYQVTFIASDGKSQDSKTITITVNNVNRPPVLATIGNKSVNANSALSFSISATDADGDTITYSAQNLPTGATFVGQTFSWTPNTSQAGSYQVTFIASDGNAQDSETITITVSIVGSTNHPPVLAAISNKSVNANSALSFSISATDVDGDTITYSAQNLPSGATFIGQTFSWTPNTSQAGSYQVTFIASDGKAQDSKTITIIVYSTDTSAPTVSGLFPAAGSIQISLDTLIILHVTDNGVGVDANSVTIKVNGNIVYTGDTTDYNSLSGCCHRTGTNADYTFIYQPNATFDYDQTVSVVVNAKDFAGNAMSQYSYSFVTETRSFGENKMVDSSSNNLSKGHPATVRDSAGNIWVAWHAGTVSSSGIKRGIYVGKLPAGANNFGTSVREANNPSDRCNAALAIDADDKLYLAWQDNRLKKWDIYMSTSVDGINWSTETKVTDSDNNAVNPVIAIDHSTPPKAYIAWQDDRSGNQDIYIASSSDGFATETTSRITSDSSDHINPAIAVDSANNVYVVWADSRNGSSDIYGASSNNGPWANVPFVTKPGNQTNPAIATEDGGTILLHLLWVDDTAGNKDIYYAASNGLPKTPLAGRNIIDDNSGADQLTPVIITNGSTGAGLRVFACWQDMRNIVKSGNTDLYFVDVNNGKETNIFVSNNATSSNQSAPVIGVDRYGYPYLVWVDDRNQNTDIYYAGSTFVHSNALASQNVSPASDAIIGTKPANITSMNDISIAVPTGAYPCELNITISKVENPPKLPVSLFTFPYEFGPSGMDFNQPVTITIPYSVSASNSQAFAYWYNKLADALSQQGITNVETIAISPTLYAIQFKTTHFSQFIVGGSISSSIQVTKCTITAGSKDNSDKISISGKIDATADNFNNATVIEVTVDSNDMVNPCVLTFPINSKTLKKDKYSHSGTENGVKKSFKYDVKTHSFVYAANNVNLSGLGCPLTFDINVGDYIGTAEISETIVNGKNKPIPIILLMGVKDSLIVNKCQVKPGNKKPNTDQLLVTGNFTVEDTNVDMANRVSEGLVVTLGTQTFTIPANELITGNGKFTCSKAEVTEGGIAMVSFNFNKCSFMLTIQNTHITASSGTVDFGVAFAGYSQITLM